MIHNEYPIQITRFCDRKHLENLISCLRKQGVAIALVSRAPGRRGRVPTIAVFREWLKGDFEDLVADFQDTFYIAEKHGVPKPVGDKPFRIKKNCSWFEVRDICGKWVIKDRPYDY